jgi:hypothetical protein
LLAPGNAAAYAFLFSVSHGNVLPGHIVQRENRLTS